MDQQFLIDPEKNITSDKPIRVNPSSPIPDLSPEEYLRNSKNLLQTDQPESLSNNFLLFSPLLPVIAFIIISLSVIGSYVNQREQQIAEIRSNAQANICATGSYLGCIHPGDSCGSNKICVSGKDPQNLSLCDCLERSPGASEQKTTSSIPRSHQLLSGFQIVSIGFGIILLFMGIFLWIRLKNRK